MIWKLYRALAAIALQYLISACFGKISAAEIDEQLETINRLVQIITCLKQLASYHPCFLADTYGGVDGYLQIHLSQADWLLLVRIIESEHAPYQSQTRLF